MKKKLKILFIFLLLFHKNTFSQIISAELFASGFSQPVAISHDFEGNLYVAENKGSIKRINSNGSIEIFLDITLKVNNAYSGIHGFAFDSQFASNGFIYVKYVNDLTKNCYISRFSRDQFNPNYMDSNTELVLLQYPDWVGHLGGNIEFGKDGFLYFTTGDGAPGGRGQVGDEFGFAQNLESVKGKLMRIDVSSGQLSFPITNPHLSESDNIPNEIIANGLRNPWKFSFDKLTGDLWLADVGQDYHEEIDFIPFGTFENSNFGWSCYEGNRPILPNNCNNSSILVNPIHVYDGFNLNGGNSVSVTGGYVYRGSSYTSLQGWYIFADFATDDFWKLKKNSDGSTSVYNLGKLVDKPVSFGEDLYGEIFVASYSEGKIYKLKSECEQSKISENEHFQNTHLIAAVHILSRSQVLNPIRILYESGSSISLEPGFKVNSGATFKAEIKGCE